MARMPEARWLGEHGSRSMTRYDIVCMHTIVGYAPAHAAHFSTHGNGQIDQSRDTRFRSAANLDGNYRIIAVENEDHGDEFPDWAGSNVPPLTDAQVVANGKILYWSHETHGVPLQLCPNSRPESKGLAYHRQGIDGNFGSFKYPGRVAGGEIWTNHFGKVCPGDKRIDQRNDVLDIATTLKRGGSIEEDDMTAEDVWKYRIKNFGKNGDTRWAMGWLLRTFNVSNRTEQNTKKLLALVRAQGRDLDALRADFATAAESLKQSGVEINEANLAMEILKQLAQAAEEDSSESSQ